VLPLKGLRVLLAEDDDFTRLLVRDLLINHGMMVKDFASVSEALASIEDFDPNVVISDLNFTSGPNGADLLNHVENSRPWTGIIALTSHASPELAIPSSSKLPESTIYMIKSQLSSSELLKEQIFESIKKNGNIQKVVTNNAEQYVVSSLQGEILKMIADGLSNAAIAKKRNITLRAAEASIQRTFAALDIKSDPDQNSRVIAVQLWQQGKVVVK